jgi:CheY-like chemotaxis protein
MKILGIDDNPEINFLLDTVMKAVGHEFTSVIHGREGVELIQQNKYDIVLLDSGMPEFDSQDVLEALKRKRLLQKQKIVLFTASSISDEQLDDFMKKGVHSLIRKPVDIDLFLSKLVQIHAE